MNSFFVVVFVIVVFIVPTPLFMPPCFDDVKVDVLSVNVNGSGGINGNGRCGGGGGKEDIKRIKTTMTEEEKEEGGNVVINNNVRTSTRSLPATSWYTSPTYVPCSDPLGIS